MSGAGARLNVVPTVTVLAGIKIRLAAATKGYQLLKKKSDAAKGANGKAAPYGDDEVFAMDEEEGLGR